MNIGYPGVPSFDSIVCSSNIKDYFDSETKEIENLLNEPKNIGGVKIRILDILPENSAIFMNGQGKIVAIYKDGEIAIVPKDKELLKRITDT